MTQSTLSISADVLSTLGISGIIIAPVVATIAMDIALICFCLDNLKDHPFFTGWLLGSCFNRNSPVIFVPGTTKNGEFDRREVVLATVFSAICTAIAAIYCACLGSPMIAIALGGAWAACLAIYMLGEGLRALAQEEKTPSNRYCAV